MDMCWLASQVGLVRSRILSNWLAAIGYASGRQMRIVHVTNYVVPEYGYEELHLAKAQARLGHEVAILTSNFLHPKGAAYGVLNARFPRRKIEPAEEVVAGVRVIRLPSWELPGSRMWMRGLTRKLETLKPDVVHCHNLLQVQTVRIAARKRMTHPEFRLVVDDHMHQSVVRRSLVGRAFYATHRSVVQPFLGHEVDRFCAISGDTRDYLRELCGVKGDIELRPLGVDVEAFRPDAALRSGWRSELGLDPSRPVIAYVGKIIELKGVHVLVSAVLRLLAEHHDVVMVAVGDADAAYLQGMRQRIARAGFTDAFRFHESVPHGELPGAYAVADVAVWPRQESMAIFEAMACAVPVVVSSRSGYSALVESGPGVTFAYDDDADLADVLWRLLQSPSRASMGAAGRAVTERDYSWRSSAERYLETYTGASTASVGTPGS